MAQLGKAYIEVRADLSKFPTELRAELTKALKEGSAGVTFEELDKKAGAAGKKAADTVGDEFEKRSKSRLKKTGEKAGEDVGLGFFGVLRKLFSGNNSGSGFLSTTTELFKGFTQSAQQGFEQLSSAGSKIGEIGGKIGSAFSAIGQGIQVGMIVLAVPAVAALLAVLTELAGALFALPAGIALVVAAFAPLLIAMHGISDAVGAGFSGNLKKYNEALKGLAPSARAVVKELVALKPSFEGIKTSTQQAFFAPLVGAFKQLGSTLLPALKADLTSAAAALGVFVRGFLNLLSQPQVIATINALFATLAGILADIGPSGVQFFNAMFGLIRVGLPFVKQFADYLGSAAGKLSGLLNAAEGSGRIAEFIQGAVVPFKLLIQLIGVFGDLFGTIFGNAGIQKAGNDFLSYLVKAVGLLDEFFKSAEGRKVLKDFADAIEHTGVIVLGLAGVLIGLLEAIHYVNAGLGIAIKSVAAFFGFIGSVAVTALKAVGSFFKTVGQNTVTFFAHDIPEAFNAVANFFVDIVKSIDGFFTKTIPGWFNSLASFFEGVPKKAGDGLSSLREKVKNAIEDALKAMFDATTRGIGRMIGLFLAAPFLIKSALSSLGSTIHDAFFTALHAAEDAVVSSINAIDHYFTDVLPGQISSGLSAAYNFIVTVFNNTIDFFSQVGSRIGSAFVSIYHSIVDNVRSAITDAKNFIVSGFNSAVDFIGGLPGRIAALGPKLLNAAKELGRQIGNGLKDIGNFASDIGKDIVNTVKSGINKVIDGINRGIGDIDAAIPISLPRLPHLAHGGVIDSPTIALLGEGSRREVVLPLTDPARANQLAQQSGLTKILSQSGAAPIVNVTAILGTGQILDVLDTRVQTVMNAQGAELAFGARS